MQSDLDKYSTWKAETKKDILDKLRSEYNAKMHKIHALPLSRDNKIEIIRLTHAYAFNVASILSK
jgi:hypothetical protein